MFLLEYWKFTPALLIVGLVIHASFRAWSQSQREKQLKLKKEKRVQENWARVERVAEHFPLFIENFRGERAVLVPRADYDAMGAGGHSWGVIMVPRSFTFVQHEEFKVRGDVGTWANMYEIKVDALRLVTGLSRSEFREVVEFKPDGVMDASDRIAKKDHRLFIPFTSQGAMRYEDQIKVFGEWALFVAKKFLLDSAVALCNCDEKEKA